MIYSKLQLSWIDLGYLLSLSRTHSHTKGCNNHSSLSKSIPERGYCLPVTDISQPPGGGTLNRWLPAVFITKPLLPTHRHTFLWTSRDYHAPPCWGLSLIHSFSFSIPFSSRIRPSLSLPLLQLCGFFCFFIPSSSSQLLPFKAPIPQGWNPLSPSRAVALFEGCCDDRPRPCRRHTASSQQLYSGPGQHSTVGAFHNPTNTLTLSLTVNSTSASCQRGPEQGHAVSQRDTHRWTQKIQAHTHTHKWKQHIASKVIDRALWVATVPVQLQSLLSLREICHGQSESELQRISPWGL